jgi:YD repeat-containing protein
LVVTEKADKRGRILDIADTTTNGLPKLAANGYNAANWLTHRDFGNGLRGTWSYDQGGQIIRVTDAETNGSNPGPARINR